MALPDAATTAAYFKAPNKITNRFPFQAVEPDVPAAEADYYILKMAYVSGSVTATVVPNRKDGVARPTVEAWAETVRALV